MPDLNRWIDSVVRYAQERGPEHLVPALCMLGVQLVLLCWFFIGYVPIIVGVAAAEDYPWAPFVGFGVAGVMFFGAIAALQPVHVGYMHGTLRSMRGEGFPISELAWGFRRLPSALAMFFLTMGAVFFGTLFCYLPGLIVGWLLFLAVPALADRNQGAMDALATSYDLVMRKPMEVGLWYVVSFVILMVAAFIPMIGSLLTVPLWTVLSLTAYLFLSRERDGTG